MHSPFCGRDNKDASYLTYWCSQHAVRACPQSPQATAPRKMKSSPILMRVAQLTKNTNERRLLLKTADMAMPDNPFVTQQMAILEMNTSDGDLRTAAELLDEAEQLSPYDLSIKHSQATLCHEAR